MMPTEELLGDQEWMWEYVDHWEGKRGEHPAEDVRAFRRSFSQSVLNAFNDYDLPVISWAKKLQKRQFVPYLKK